MGAIFVKELGRIKERYEFSLDARQLGLYLFAAVAAAALAFVLGMSVGVQWERKKGGETARPAAQAGIPAAKPAAGVPVVPAAPPVAPPSATQELKREAPQEAQPEASAPLAEKQPDNLTFPKVLTSNTKKTAPMVPDKKPAGSSNTYTVQVGAYNEKGAASSSAGRLRKKGYDARVDVVAGAKGAYKYKVRVGSYGTRDEAKAAAVRLEAGEKLVPYVTREK